MKLKQNNTSESTGPAHQPSTTTRPTGAPRPTSTEAAGARAAQATSTGHTRPAPVGAGAPPVSPPPNAPHPPVWAKKGILGVAAVVIGVVGYDYLQKNWNTGSQKSSVDRVRETNDAVDKSLRASKLQASDQATKAAAALSSNITK